MLNKNQKFNGKVNCFEFGGRRKVRGIIRAILDVSGDKGGGGDGRRGGIIGLEWE